MKTRRKIHKNRPPHDYLHKFSSKNTTKNKNNLFLEKKFNTNNFTNAFVKDFNNTNNFTNKNGNTNIKNNQKRSDFYPIKNDMTHLLQEYQNRLVELHTKQVKFKTTFKECLKWKKNLNKDFLALKTFNIPNNKCTYDTLKVKIKYIENIIAKINKEHSYIIAFSEVCYRSKHGLLHTLPKKKLNIIQNIFPNIQSAIMKSRINYRPQKKICFPKKQSIRFGKVYIKKI